ncbi:MAG: hypothetical protein V2A71_03095, partial [Candidatus Eisenbacteria bacterium]
MRKLLHVVPILCVITPFAGGGPGVRTAHAGTNYYISSSLGNDSNDGLSPETAWRTLYTVFNKCLYGPNFEPGDSILLKRGNSWANELKIRSYGTEEAPIVIASYGEGARPILRGHVALPSWTPVAGHPGVYSSPIEMGTIFSSVFEGG